MDSQFLKNRKFPNGPGVYFFKEGKEILYVGRATSIADRLKSYFSRDLMKTRGPITVEMVEKANNIEFQKTDSVLEAIILEANLIKKFQPAYNIKEKDDKSFNYVVITKEDFPKVLIVRGRDLLKKLSASNSKFENYWGPFPSGSSLKEALKFVRKIFPYRDEKCEIKQGRPCFNYYLGLCPGVCIGKISQSDYKKTIKNIESLFKGDKKKVLEGLEREMNCFAKNEQFERAGDLKKKIFALRHIHDVALIKNEKLNDKQHKPDIPFRIEAYDVAHFAGKNARGVMVVMEDGDLIKNSYRVFIIKKAKEGDDIGALSEILTRRFLHKEWPLPNLIVVDGGKSQLKVAQNIWELSSHKMCGSLAPKSNRVAIVSVVKDEHHKPREVLGNSSDISEHKEEILLINSEAHRFSISKHRRALRQFHIDKKRMLL